MDLKPCMAARRYDALHRVTVLQVQVLMKWLGEPADADATAVFATLSRFAQVFDKAYTLVTAR